MAPIKIGLLPLYLELYDQSLPERRAGFEEFLKSIQTALESRGMEIVPAPVCRLKEEFSSEVKEFECEGAAGIVTLHLAYSPSLESADVLAGTELPLIVLDTTMDYDFSPTAGADKIMHNHGIHGVMDMCNLLVRNGKSFEIEAGHWQESDVLDRVAGHCRSAAAAQAMKNARAGVIGKPFDGMGDFAIPFDQLKQDLGMTVVQADPEQLADLAPAADDEEVIKELAADKERFNTEGLAEDVLVNAVRTDIALKRWLDKEKLTAFSMNFLAVDKASGLPAVPFLAASKAMADGIGYAGEGDVMTAAFVGALASVWPEASFTEMFCPDWKGDTVFMSHMGEMNCDLAANKAKLIEKPFVWTDIGNPAAAVGRFKAGDCIFADLAPGPDNTYSLILIPGEMQAVDGEDAFEDTVHGWFKPASEDLAWTLQQYSLAGGTHHSAVVYGNVLNELVTMGTMLGWDVLVIA